MGIFLDSFWYDNRLKNDPIMDNLPTLPSSTEFVLWTPALVFLNTNLALATTRNTAGINESLLDIC